MRDLTRFIKTGPQWGRAGKGRRDHFIKGFVNCDKEFALKAMKSHEKLVKEGKNKITLR